MPDRALTPGELLIVVVVVIAAAALAAYGLPTIGALEFIAGALYVACRSVIALRSASQRPSEAA
ncbi:hypothetical protein AB0C77_09460 [Streptomyces sp. NPDC048629]|uniref:hypothetical protein n=1 Tax=Streptomyces sp. NPDC048629 TaxID=3154824 RepID=UPI00342A09EE